MLENYKDYTSRYSFMRGISGNTLFASRLQDWVFDYYAGATVEILSGAAAGEKRKVITNTNCTLILESPLTNTPAFFKTVLGKQMPVNNRYKIYWDWTDQPAEQFNNLTVVGSCFGRHTGIDDPIIMKEMFPALMAGTTFTKCNLDNVVIPVGNSLVISDDGIVTSNRKMKVQNDLEDWILDGVDKPVEPVNKKLYEKYGVSVDPADIPAERLNTSVIKTAILGAN